MLTPTLPLAQVGAQRDALAVAADVSSIVIAAAVLVVLVMTAFLFRRMHQILGEVRLGFRQNLGPASDRARAISDNVEYITRVVRSDAESLHESLQALSDRLTLASERMEERIEEFNALMEVVQGEAEGLFVETAATVRGVREGARSIASGRERARGEHASASSSGTRAPTAAPEREPERQSESEAG